jgi:hypothetical protein
MSLVMHQLRKELRWLWPRWVLFLVVLWLDLAMCLGWVLPMKIDGKYGLYEIMAVLVWVVALWVGISGAPEDSADGGRAFTATRPLARRHYWLARLLVWLLLVVLPMALETGLYLVLMQRPWSEVGLGMAEQLFAVGSATLWVLPAVLLFRSWQRYVALVVFFALWIGEYGRKLLTHVFKLIDIKPSETFSLLEPMRFVQSAWLVGSLMAALLVWHQRRQLSLLSRLLGLGVLLLICQAVAVLPVLDMPTKTLTDVILLRQLKETPPEVHARDIEVNQSTDNQMNPRLRLVPKVKFENLPHGMVPSVWDGGSLFRQKNHELPTFSSGSRTYKDLPFIGYTMFGRALGGDLPAPWPADALTMDSGNSQNAMFLPYLPMLEDLETPVEVDMHWGVHWVQMRELGNAPLKVGSRIQSPEAELEVVGMEVGTDGRGAKSPTTITLTVREGFRILSGQNSFWPMHPMLMIHAPDKRLIWQREVNGFTDWRGMRHGWMRTLKKVSFGDVLRPGTGVTPETVNLQQLVWMKPDYLGSTQHESKITDLRLSDQIKSGDYWPWTQPTLRQRENPREEFLSHLRRLKRPAVDAPRGEIARFVAAVMSSSRSYQGRHSLNENLEPKWPGNDREMGELIAPYIVKHPELLKAARFEKEEDVLGAILLHAGIPGFQRGEGDEPPSYLRLLPEPGRPDVTHQLMRKPWWQGNNGKIIPVVVAMLKSGSDEPFRPLVSEEKMPITEIWRLFLSAADGFSLRTLAADPKYREQALREVNRQYAGLPHRVSLESVEPQIIAAKAVSGDAAALDWLLRWWGTREETGVSVRLRLCDSYYAVFGRQITLREVPALILESRRRSAKDYRYDAKKMIWELLP